jgi:tetratricopeptide (TPR) repeat protein
MFLALKLNNGVMSIAALVIILAVCAALGYIVLSHFIINTLSDDGVVVVRSTLANAAAYFPNSARIQARRAKVELAETMGDEAEMTQVEAAALSAVRLSPWRADNHLLLASVRNLQGDLDAMEASLRTALKLAPNSAQAHWQLANALVRQDKVEESLKEFQAAVALDSSARLLPGAIDVAWNISDGNVDQLVQVVGKEPRNRLVLAHYLLKRTRTTEAVELVKGIERQALLDLPAATEFIDALLAAGQTESARDLWGYLNAEDGATVLQNGGFEKDLVKGLMQFNWKLSKSDYATVAVDSAVAHSGTRSLRLRFAGRDTTVLDRELSQTVLVKPGVRYRLECFAKTEKFVTSEGLRVVVTDLTSPTPLAVSTPITAGSTNWQPHMLEFIAPAKSPAVLVSIKRTPKFSYDEPTTGTVWFDDFTLARAVK